jgi:DUF971 family protein
MSVTPVSIKRIDNDIVIGWSDDSSRKYSPALLRRACPCALCKEKKSEEVVITKPLALPVISMAETKPLQVTSMQPVGNYAYNIHFSDGHNSGIYDFQYLFDMGF